MCALAAEALLTPSGLSRSSATLLSFSRKQSEGDETREAARKSGQPSCASRDASRRNLIVLTIVALVWIAFDQASKGLVNEGSNHGRVVAGPILGLFDVRLVYNTGGAWSIFSNATFALGAFSILMCAALLAVAVRLRARLSLAEVVGLALVIAGGLGNAIDRFALGHVVDFIDVTFIDFPIFNVADIGVTCGLALFLVSWLVREGHKSARASGDEGSDLGNHASGKGDRS